MPGAKLTSIDISQSKAFTAAGHRNPTSLVTKRWCGRAEPAFGLNSSNGGQVHVCGRWNVPIKVDGECVGAIGCSNGTPVQDAEVGGFPVEVQSEKVVAHRKDRSLRPAWMLCWRWSRSPGRRSCRSIV